MATVLLGEVIGLASYFSDTSKSTGITLDVRPDSRSADSAKKSGTLERNASRDPLARMERTLRLHCINLQMAVSVMLYLLKRRKECS